MDLREMRVPLSLIVLSFVAIAGCASLSHRPDVPMTWSEQVAMKGNHLENPVDTCDFGYQKVYYVLNGDEGTVLTFTNCLNSEQAELLKTLEKGEEQTEVASLIERFRVNAPEIN